MNPEVGIINPGTFGFVPTDLFLVRSFDGGRSWIAPEKVEPPLIGSSWELCHHIVELKDGRWLAPTSTWRGWNGENPSGDQAVSFISDDHGKSWPSFGRVFDGRETGLGHFEQSVLQLQDGRVLAISWVYDPKTGSSLPTEYSISMDRGQTFSEPTHTGFEAQTCKVTQLRDGRLVCAYRRNDRPGLWATLVRLEGDRWANLGEASLSQGAESSMSGKGNSAEELSSLKFGYPSLRQLASGKSSCCFGVRRSALPAIRWIRFQIT
jgi:hypothetical protein